MNKPGNNGPAGGTLPPHIRAQIEQELTAAVQRVIDVIGPLHPSVPGEKLLRCAQRAVMDQQMFARVQAQMLPEGREQTPVWAIQLVEVSPIITTDGAGEGKVVAEVRAPIDIFRCEGHDDVFNWMTVMGYLGNPHLRAMLYLKDYRINLRLLKYDPDKKKEADRKTTEETKP